MKNKYTENSMPSIDANTSLTLTHYKEPLRAIPKSKGFGYYGALLSTIDGTKVQCHVCGKLFSDLAQHALQKHKEKPRAYREKFELAMQTALISESEREARKERTMQWWFALSADEKAAHMRESKSAYKKWAKGEGGKDKRFTISLETKNKRGTCPDQLIARILAVKEKLGHVPSKQEFIVECGTQRFIHLIYKTFGSYVNAVKKAGLKPKVKGNNAGKSVPRYSDEELLEYLSSFFLEQKRPPTESDARRGYIPNSQLYTKRFGGLVRAREIAGIYQEPGGRWGTKRKVESMLKK